MKIKIVKPIGHCFGVISAIELAKKIRAEYKKSNIYLFGMLVHNEVVEKELSSLGIYTVEFNKENAYEKLSLFSKEDIVIFSAHGHDLRYENYLKDRDILYFDATCQRVKKCFEIIKEKHEVIYIGKANHPECNAALTMNDNTHFFDINKPFDFSVVKSEDPVIINQTTLSFLELENIHKMIQSNLPKAKIIDEICDATYLRQKAIIALEDEIDLIVIVGSKSSSNTLKLYEVAKNYHHQKTVLLVEKVEDLQGNCENYQYAAIASGTSTPFNLIKEVEQYLGGK